MRATLVFIAHLPDSIAMGSWRSPTEPKTPTSQIMFRQLLLGATGLQIF